jgi:hypothetical protein
MRNVWFGFLIILAAVVVTHTGGSTGGGGGGSGTTTSLFAPHCGVTANGIRADNGRIVASARFSCDRPGASSLTMNVALQKKDANGNWSNVATGSLSASGSNTTTAQSNTQRTREPSAQCASGTYRTFASVTAVINGDRENKNSTSSPKSDPCG